MLLNVTREASEYAMTPKIAALVLLLAGTVALAQDRVPLRSLTQNNSSASNSFRGEPNGNEPPANISKLPLRSLLYPGATTQIFVRWMPWFSEGKPGEGKHIEVGYSSADAAQIRRQVDDMMSRGIDGAIVDWYGRSDPFKDHATELLLREAESRGGRFKVALSVDKGSIKNCQDCTGALLGEMNYAAQKYEGSPAYLRFQDRPAVFFFGLETAAIDWQRIKGEATGSPLLFFRNSGAFRLPYGDGAYSWIAPDSAKPNDPLGFEYLQRFDEAARASNKIVVASAYKGFDDSQASWGKHRQIPQQCGMTWLESFALANWFFSQSHPLPALLIPTWNDYEEGTEIESGIDNCVQITAEVEGSRLRWRVKGPEQTIDHFEVLVGSSNDRDELTRVATLPPGKHEMDLSSPNISPGQYAIYVQAIGRPSLRNQLSPPVSYVRAR